MVKVKPVFTALIIALTLTILFPAFKVNSEENDAKVVKGKLYCITSAGELVYKAGVCPVEHLGHIILTEDGKALMITHGRGEELIRKIAIPPGASVTVVGKIIKKLNSIDVEEIKIPVAGGG
jgi:hypothetical protein